jgi:hypothetical protein
VQLADRGYRRAREMHEVTAIVRTLIDLATKPTP